MKTPLINVKLRLVFSITIFFIWFCGSAQTNYWNEDVSRNATLGKSLQGIKKSKTRLFTLDKEMFARNLEEVSNSGNGTAILYFPDEEGELTGFTLVEKSNMAPELAAKFPAIKSYVGESVDGSGKRLRFSISHKGIQSMMVDKNKGVPTFMQKTQSGKDRYVVYARDPNTTVDKDFICTTKDEMSKNTQGLTAKLVDGQVLRKFRLAVSTTGEYADFHGGTVADAMAAINATMTRVNEVFERDLAVTLELVANNDALIFTDAATDPYTNNLNSQVQTTLTNVIGEANYDIGHLFHEAPDGGDAGFIGRVCSDNQKGSAFAASRNPMGDIFDLDFVAHEMGHQLGANHTWSFQSEGTGVQAEPASGTTIMGYAGIVPGNNVAPNGDDYFHYYSILQIQQNLSVVSCAEIIPISNNPPTIAAIGDFVIPKSTAFVLAGDVSDTDAGDVLSYTWEQIDDGVVVSGTFGPTNPAGANFRSLRPTNSPERYFPQLSRIAQGSLTQINPTINGAWETVSSVQRDLNFALTVRDNGATAGQVASELVKVSVTDAAGPFEITSQRASENYEAGSVQNVTWDVAGTNSAPVNASRVDIFLSTDGGNTFPILLADDVLNDGSEMVLIPGISTTTARFMVKASDNIFLAVNAANFAITESEIVLGFDTLAFEVCKPDDLVVPFSYETYAGFAEEVTFSASGVPAGLDVAFSPLTATANDTPVTITFTNTTNVPSGDYAVTIVATSANSSKEVVLDLSIYDATLGIANLVAPLDAETDTSIETALDWEAPGSATSYDIEIATDAGFTSIIESANDIFFNTYRPLNLVPDTTYFWRVKAKNSCGEGAFSAAFSFTTITINCTTAAASDLPLAISSSGTPTITSKITFFEDLPINDLNVDLNIRHEFLSDLVVRLIAPSGTTAVLVSNSCGTLRNIDAVFDDDAAPFTCSGTPAIRGTVRPLGSLSVFNGESIQGEWILEVSDTQPSDGGSLESFSLDICVEGAFRPDADGDGVFDDGDDLCLGTPPGQEVDTDGCAVYRFESDNFEITLNSETCSANNDGTIAIEANDASINYQVRVVGNGVDESTDFTSSFLIENLAAGSYEVCITGNSGTIVYEEQCQTVQISEPDALMVASRLSANGEQVVLTLEGATFYNIEINGILEQTEASEFTVDLTKGENTLKVYTSLPCQGVYEELFFGAIEAVIYPNPVVDVAKIFVGNVVAQASVSIFGMNGQLLRSAEYTVSDNEITLDFSTLPSGVYLIRLEGNAITETFKVVKQ